MEYGGRKTDPEQQPITYNPVLGSASRKSDDSSWRSPEYGFL